MSQQQQQQQQQRQQQQQLQFYSFVAEDAKTYDDFRAAADGGVCATCIAALEKASYGSNKSLLRMLAFVMACRADMAAQVLHEQKQVTAAAHAQHALDRAQLAVVRRELPRLFLLLKLFQKQLIATQLERDRQAAQLAATQLERESQAAQLAAMQQERDRLAALLQERDSQATQLAAAMQQERDLQATQLADLLLKQSNLAAQLSDLQGVRDRLEATRSELTQQLEAVKRERDQLAQQQQRDQTQQLAKEKQQLAKEKQQRASSQQKDANHANQLTSMQKEQDRLAAQVKDGIQKRAELAAQVEDKKRELAELSYVAMQLTQRVDNAKEFMVTAEKTTIDTLDGMIATTVAGAQATTPVSNRQCARCDKPNGLHCCGTIYYCNNGSCQNLDRKIHKYACQRKKTNATATAATTATAAATAAKVGDVNTRVEELQLQYHQVLCMGELSIRLPELLKLVNQVQKCRQDVARACDDPVFVSDKVKALDDICRLCRAACKEWIYSILSRLPYALTLDNFRGAVISSCEGNALSFVVIEQICNAFDLADGGQALPAVYQEAATLAAAAAKPKR